MAAIDVPVKYFSEQLLKDVCEIHARCLDHRPVLQGHIHFFLKEFEEKRGEREKVRLEATQSILKKLNETLLPETNQAMEIFLKDITAKLQVATEMCRKAEDGCSKIEVDDLEGQRESRRHNWEDFMVQQCHRSARVDEEYFDAIAKIKDDYAELENKLKQPAPVTP